MTVPATPPPALEAWRCSGCGRLLAKAAILAGTVQIKCRSCGTLNALTVR